MGQAKNVAQGFIAVASAICLFVTLVWFPSYLNLYVAVGLLLLLALPFAVNCVMVLKRFRNTKQDTAGVKRAKNVLMSLQGFGFACWFFDVLSTIFVVNIKQSGAELNILGWPFGGLCDNILCSYPL